MTFKSLPTVAGTALINHTMNIRSLQNKFAYEHAHQYVHELMQGEDPRQSDWFQSAYPKGVTA